MYQPNHKSFRQLIRYLSVGAFNTVFGYGVFALLNWSFKSLGSYSYMLAWALANGIAITVAFLGYKWLVFRTRGNYLIEYVRCLGVYGSGMLFGLVSLPVMVTVLRRTMRKPDEAPYIAVALLTIVTVALSFMGHKSFSFRQGQGRENTKGRAE